MGEEKADSQLRIDVIYFVFDADTRSDVSVAESADSLGAQTFDPTRVAISIVATDRSGIDDAFVEKHFGPFAAAATIVAAETDDYSQNKLSTFATSDADIVAFADSDVIYRPDWLTRIDRAISGGADGLAGPPRFKPGSPLRTSFLLADFGLLWEEERKHADHFNLHNFAIRRDALLGIESMPAPFHRFGAPSFMARQMRARGQRVALDRRHVAIHGLNWRVWLGEKRMRRYAHSAYMPRNDPNADPAHAYGSRPDHPITWLRLWARWTRRYQARVNLCAKPLKMRRPSKALQRVLLALVSLWELAIILYLAAFPPALRRMARRNDWW